MSYVAIDRIQHNSVTYAAGDILDEDDFSKNQLSILLDGGVIEVVFESADITDQGGTDAGVDTGAADAASPAVKPKK